jgi:hypothetical protein
MHSRERGGFFIFAMKIHPPQKRKSCAFVEMLPQTNTFGVCSGLIQYFCDNQNDREVIFQFIPEDF